MTDYTDEQNVEAFWNDYYPRLKRAIAGRVRGLQTPANDVSEVALSAIHSFVEGATAGKFDDLDNQDALWGLLKTIAIRKVNDRRKHYGAKKRGGDLQIVNEGVGGDSQDAFQLANLAEAAPTNNQDEEVIDLFNHLLAAAPDQRTKDIILLRLQGAPIATIADGLNLSTKTVRRTLDRIEHDWREHFLS